MAQSDLNWLAKLDGNVVLTLASPGIAHATRDKDGLTVTGNWRVSLPANPPPQQALRAAKLRAINGR